MMNIFKKNQKKQRAVFSVNIDLLYEYAEAHNTQLRPGKSFCYDSQEKEKFTYEDIKKFITKKIETEFRKDFEEISGIPIRHIKVNRSYEGSIELVFTILFNTYQFIAGLKDFFDSIELIKRLSERFIKSRLEEEFNYDMFTVSTSILYPKTEYYYEKMNLNNGKSSSELIDSSYKKRDVFFYYLLFANIILVTVLFFLIYKAVAQTYGW